jgi:hypothetical protein
MNKTLCFLIALSACGTPPIEPSFLPGPDITAQGFKIVNQGADITTDKISNLTELSIHIAKELDPNFNEEVVRWGLSHNYLTVTFLSRATGVQPCKGKGNEGLMCWGQVHYGPPSGIWAVEGTDGHGEDTFVHELCHLFIRWSGEDPGADRHPSIYYNHSDNNSIVRRITKAWYEQL